MINQAFVKRPGAGRPFQCATNHPKAGSTHAQRIRPMFRPLLSCSFLILIAGCARSEEARYAQSDNAPLPALNTADPGEEDELTVGTWQTGLQEDRPVL